jgi:hypothetical protein
MSKTSFSEQELAFFEEGETLSDTRAPTDDFSDMQSAPSRSSSWASRALAVLSFVGATRSES